MGKMCAPHSPQSPIKHPNLCHYCNSKLGQTHSSHNMVIPMCTLSWAWHNVDLGSTTLQTKQWDAQTLAWIVTWFVMNSCLRSNAINESGCSSSRGLETQLTAITTRRHVCNQKTLITFITSWWTYQKKVQIENCLPSFKGLSCYNNVNFI